MQAIPIIAVANLTGSTYQDLAQNIIDFYGGKGITLHRHSQVMLEKLLRKKFQVDYKIAEDLATIKEAIVKTQDTFLFKICKDRKKLFSYDEENLKGINQQTKKKFIKQLYKQDYIVFHHFKGSDQAIQKAALSSLAKTQKNCQEQIVKLEAQIKSTEEKYTQKETKLKEVHEKAIEKLETKKKNLASALHAAPPPPQGAQIDTLKADDQQKAIKILTEQKNKEINQYKDQIADLKHHKKTKARQIFEVFRRNSFRDLGDFKAKLYYQKQKHSKIHNIIQLNSDLEANAVEAFDKVIRELLAKRICFFWKSQITDKKILEGLLKNGQHELVIKIKKDSRTPLVTQNNIDAEDPKHYRIENLVIKLGGILSLLSVIFLSPMAPPLAVLLIVTGFTLLLVDTRYDKRQTVRDQRKIAATKAVKSF